jgi:hypothetical protein
MRRAASLLLFCCLAAAGCGGPTVDLPKNLEVKDVTTTWWDAGVVDGSNKLVPMITFTVVNHSDQKLDQLQLNVVFRRLNEPQVDWGSAFLMNPTPGGLAAGASSEPFTLKSNLGYKGTDPREVIMRSQFFIDAKVDVYAKYSSVQWKKIGEYPIAHTLTDASGTKATESFQKPKPTE